MKLTSSSLIVGILACGSLLLGAEVRDVDLNSFSQEGRLEQIKLRLDKPTDEPLFLEVYEFHPIMKPDLAPPEDTWKHERQMEHMRQVLAGNGSAYQPQSGDPKVEQILRTVEPLSYPMQRLGDGDYAASWKAVHGRIYFRFRLGDKALEPVYSMRVHCRHADMRNAERFKQALHSLQLPLSHQHPEMAATVFEMAKEAYRRGHGLRYMMTHHEEDASRLDDGMTQLEADIAEARWQDARTSLQRLLDEVRSAEHLFRQTRIRRDGTTVQLSISDRTGFDYAQDPETEVFVRAAGSQPAPAHAHSSGSQHDHHAAPDRESLTAGAVRLQAQSGTVPVFLGTVPEEWERLEVVVIYGDGQRYFWTDDSGD